MIRRKHDRPLADKVYLLRKEDQRFEFGVISGDIEEIFRSNVPEMQRLHAVGGHDFCLQFETCAWIGGESGAKIVSGLPGQVPFAEECVDGWRRAEAAAQTCENGSAASFGKRYQCVGERRDPLFDYRRFKDDDDRDRSVLEGVYLV